MKIRSGFVSNSSSSSFCFVGREVSYDEANNLLGKEELYIYGKDLYDAKDIMIATKELLELSKSSSLRVFLFLSDVKTDGVYLSTLPSHATHVFDWEKDQDYTENAEMFLSRYCGGVECLEVCDSGYDTEHDYPECFIYGKKLHLFEAELLLLNKQRVYISLGDDIILIGNDFYQNIFEKEANKHGDKEGYVGQNFISFYTCDSQVLTGTSKLPSAIEGFKIYRTGCHNVYRDAYKYSIQSKEE